MTAEADQTAQTGGQSATSFKLGDFELEGQQPTDEAPKGDEDAGQTGDDLDDDHGETGENGTGETEGDGEGEGEGEGQPKRKGKPVQERIDELTAARREAEREAEFWKNKALAKDEGKEPKEAEPAAAKADDDPEPDSAKYEYGEADSAFIRDSARWHARQEFRAERAKEEEAEQQRQLEQRLTAIDQQWNERKASASEKYADFDEKVTQGADRNAWPCPPVVALGIRMSEVGADVAYHLATNVDEAKRIASLTPLDQARELGRIEARFMAESEAKPAPKVTEAPPPPPTRSRGAGGQYESSARAEYRKMLEAMK